MEPSAPNNYYDVPVDLEVKQVTKPTGIYIFVIQLSLYLNNL